MKYIKNLMMLYFSGFVILISLITHFLHRSMGFLDDYVVLNTAIAERDSFHLILNVLLIIPILLWTVSFVYYRNQKTHDRIPLFLTLSLTFSSISIIAGGDGLVEYHFSIFMVIASLAYFNSINLILVSTIIFAIHHLGCYFAFPELICGTSNYKFSLLLIHAVFLLFTSAATIIQIYVKQRETASLQKENSTQKTLIEEMMKNIRDTSSQVLQSVEQIKNGSQESAYASHNITSSILEMASGSDKQFQRSAESNELLNRMIVDVNKMASKYKILSDSSYETTEEARKGQESIQATIQQMERITHSVEEISGRVQKLGERSKRIEDILTVISSIASQTNLLALNAAIESARAGEAGKGFAVVAAEVRKLANQAEESAGEISALIIEMHKETQSVIHSMENGANEVKYGIKIVTETGLVFEDILQSTNQVTNKIKEVSTISNGLVIKSAQVAEAMNEVMLITEEANANAESISAASEEQLATIENMEKTTETLSNLAEKLDELLEEVYRKN
ncbi:methyl-accepting chemotaxis protein [Peribacillus saganii]|uniref:Methyl-accepting chemotaxis protein n=1 Tax=Peribacillus saganii TaxID=2303992 RepID=A0A372LS77_9BACI|nr:methyl-accepting chemotaxis protein [Peribacillus saganii]RFU70404.1 methyl-accepting chemotaxis protein [Peribacillus saganii]